MTKFGHGISRLKMTHNNWSFIWSFLVVTPTMKKITNLTMNLYILLNPNTADGLREPFTKF